MSGLSFDPVDGKRIDSPRDPWEPEPVRVDFGAGRFDPEVPGMSEGSWRLSQAAEALEAGRLLDERDDYQVVDDQVAALGDAGEPSWGAYAGAKLREALELPVDPEGLLEGRRPATAGDLAALPDAALLNEDVSTHAMAGCRRPHRGGRWCSWHQRLGRFVFTLDGASYACLLPHTRVEIGPPPVALSSGAREHCTTSYGWAQGDCAMWMNADTLCDKRRGHDDGVHRGHDPSGSGAWFECDDFGVEIRSSTEPVRFAGRVTVRKADLEAHQPLAIDVIRGDLEAAGRAELASGPAAAAEPAPVSPFAVTGDGEKEPRSVATARKQLADALGSRPGELMPTWAELVAAVRAQAADLQVLRREQRRRLGRGTW